MVSDTEIKNMPEKQLDLNPSPHSVLGHKQSCVLVQKMGQERPELGKGSDTGMYEESLGVLDCPDKNQHFPMVESKLVGVANKGS